MIINSGGILESYKSTTEDVTLSEAENHPKSAVLVGLPDELLEWVEQNQDLILRIQAALKDSYANLTNDQLWEAIAANSSPEWRLARADLQDAEKTWNSLHHPAKMPLGLIGQALDSEETNSAGDRYTLSLSHFTIIDEGLRQRPDLEKLLNVLLVQKRMLGGSETHTRRTFLSTEQLADMDPLKDAFRHAARRRGVMVRQLKTVMKGFFTPQNKLDKTTGVIVPWSPKI